MPPAGREFLAPAGGFSVRPAFGPGQGAPPHAFGKGPADAFGKGPADRLTKPPLLCYTIFASLA